MGLNLTRATLNAVLKYPWKRDIDDPRPENRHYRKYGYYRSDEDDFRFAREGFPATDGKSLEAEVMDYADQVAYSVHDLDDFYRAGLIPLDRLIPSESGRTPRELDAFLRRWVARGRAGEGAVEEQREDLERFLGSLPVRDPYTGTFDQRALLRTCTSNLIKEFIFAPTLRPAGGVGEYLHIDPALQFKIDFLHGLVEDYVIINPRLGTQQYGQREIIRKLFSVYLDAVRQRDTSLVPPLFHRELEHVLGSAQGTAHPSQVRLAVDIVAGFTDSQALAVHRRLTGAAPGSVTELIHG